MNLIIKLLLGIFAGILLGNFAPNFLIRTLLTFEGLFSSFLTFIVPFIILFFIMSGIASLSRNSGRILSATVGLAYGSTILAGAFACVLVLSFSDLFASNALVETTKVTALTPFFFFEIKPVMDIFTALITAFIFGIGISLTQANQLKTIFDQGRSIVELVISRFFIPLLPIFIMCIFANMTSSGDTANMLYSFAKVLILAIVAHWIYILVVYFIASAVAGQNPIKALKNMLPAYFTAVGTMSSTATIPVALKHTSYLVKNVSISNFTVPLCATIHLAGSMITIVICSVVVQIITPGTVVPTFFELIPFILMLGITMVAAPGVPGGAVMAALGILQSILGFNDIAIALVIALYLAQDSFGTACNVICDGAIAMLIDKFAAKDGLQAGESLAEPANP